MCHFEGKLVPFLSFLRISVTYFCFSDGGFSGQTWFWIMDIDLGAFRATIGLKYANNSYSPTQKKNVPIKFSIQILPIWIVSSNHASYSFFGVLYFWKMHSFLPKSQLDENNYLTAFSKNNSTHWESHLSDTTGDCIYNLFIGNCLLYKKKPKTFNL